MAKITLGEALSTLKRKEIKFLRAINNYVEEVDTPLSNYVEELGDINLILSETGDIEKVRKLKEELNEKAKEEKEKAVNEAKEEVEKLMSDIIKLKLTIQKTNKEVGIDDYLSELKYLKIALSQIGKSDLFCGYCKNAQDAKEYGLIEFVDNLEKRKYELESKILNKNHTTLIEIPDEILED
jgi:phenylalanyl-tRNA synthetase alpha subunit